MQEQDSDDNYRPEHRSVQVRTKKPFRQSQINEIIEFSRQFDTLRLFDDESELNPPIKKVKSNELDQKYQHFIKSQPTVGYQEPPQQDMQQEEDDQAQLYFLDDDQENTASD